MVARAMWYFLIALAAMALGTALFTVFRRWLAELLEEWRREPLRRASAMSASWRSRPAQ
jgi:hypothetical protein